MLLQNYIKRQAHEHEGFRRFAINQAQRVHRIDMRMRLGLLHDPEAQKRMFEREQKAAEEKKRKAEAPTVRTEEEQKKYEEQKAKEEKDGGSKKKKEEPQKQKIRPLSDARAIELGANFFSETFIFLVAVGLLLAENFRSSRKASSRRDEVQERLDSLEAQVERLKDEHNLPELEALNERIKKSREVTASWWNPLSWFRRAEPDVDDGGSSQDGTGESGHGRIASIVPDSSSEKAVQPGGTTDIKATDVKAIDASSSGPATRVDSTDAGTKVR